MFLPACLHLYHVCAMHAGTSRGDLTGVANCSLYIAVWVLGLEPGSLEEQLLAVTRTSDLGSVGKTAAQRRYLQAVIVLVSRIGWRKV